MQSQPKQHRKSSIVKAAAMHTHNLKRKTLSLHYLRYVTKEIQTASCFALFRSGRVR